MLERLLTIVNDDAAIRRTRPMQPAGGQGDKIAPPTYLGERRGESSRHAFEHRRNAHDESQTLAVLLDSVASQANRLEEALKDVLAENNVRIPLVAVDFTGRTTSLAIESDGKKGTKVVLGKGEVFDVSDLGVLTSLDTPHRVFDALFRDSQIEENGKTVAFRDSKVFTRLRTAKPQNATEMFGVSPTALLFGAWDSTGTGGGLGAKFARSITSEIVGFNVAGNVRRDGNGIEPDGKRVGSRLDPTGIRKDAAVTGTNADWKIAVGDEKGQIKPSEINHSNIPPTISIAGVSVSAIRHTLVISCAGLRRLRFPNTTNQNAGRAVLAALALVAVLAQDRVGYALRSRCDLVPSGGSAFEVVHADGTTEELAITLPEALDLLRATITAAREAGFPWTEAPLVLKPQDKLVQLVALSRARALEGESEGDDE